MPHEKPLTGEELDEFERHCQGFIEDDPEDQFARIALRLIEENNELRHLLRTMQKDEAQRTVIVQAERIDKQKAMIGELQLAEQTQGDRIRELVTMVRTKEEENQRLTDLLTNVSAAIGSSLAQVSQQASLPPTRVDIATAALERFPDEIASETGDLGASHVPSVKPARPPIPAGAVTIAYPSSKKRRTESEDPHK